MTIKQMTTISIDADILKEIDNHVKKSVFKDRSSFLQYAALQTIHKKKINKTQLFAIITLLEMSMVLLILLLR